MKKFLSLCCVLLAATFLITSCKDNDPDPVIPTGGPYFFLLGEGSKWVYSNHLLVQDSSNNIVVQDLGENDTLTLEANNYGPESAIRMRHQFLNPLGAFISTTNYTILEDIVAKKVYVDSDFMKILLPNFLQEILGIALNFDDSKWYLLADANTNEEWILDSFNLTNVSLPDFGSVNYGLTFTGPLKFGAKRGRDTTISGIEANTYTLSIYLEAKLSSTIPYIAAALLLFPPLKIDLMQINFYLGIQNGLLGIYSPAGNIVVPNIPAIGDYEIAKTNGFDKRLIHIDVKK